MKGKITNISIGFMNLVVGILLFVYTKYIPNDSTLLTIQELEVQKYILAGVYFVIGIVCIVDLIQYFNYKDDMAFNMSYLLGFFVICFVFVKYPVISFFSILSGIIIIFRSIKENLVEINNSIAISSSLFVMFICILLAFFSAKYDYFGSKIKEKENKNELSYKSDYFKYVTELENDEVYINVKKDGKYGYITPSGEIVIDFKYDYASPFVRIKEYNKNFEIALVCKGESSYIILKNERVVFSYRSESFSENIVAKQKELEDIYYNTLNQSDKMEYEVTPNSGNINKIVAYKIGNDGEYIYNYNDEYDFIITESSLGLGTKFEFSKKDENGYRFLIDADNIDYDENYLYVFSNGFIPFYNTSKLSQGWFTEYGKKQEMKGKAQILDVFDNLILLRDYNSNTIYFTNKTVTKLSEEFSDIYEVSSSKFIVRKSSDGKFKLINGSFNKIFEEEFDVINPRLVSENLYLCMNTENFEISSNNYGMVDLKFSILNENGDSLINDVEQVYDLYYTLDDNNYEDFLNNLKKLNCSFVGDRFYESYNK